MQEGPCIEQFHSKHHTLVSTGASESPRAASKNRFLENRAHVLRMASAKYENGKDSKELRKIISVLEVIAGEIREFDSAVAMAIEEGIILVSDRTVSIDRLSKAKFLASAFGRGQQYVSLVRRTNPSLIKD